MRYRSLFLVAATALMAAACASTGGTDDANRITIVVTNEYSQTVTAYAVWNGRRSRLGEVSRNRTREFDTVRRGDRVALGLELLSVPGGTVGPSGGFGNPASPDAPFVRSEAIPVAAGEGIEWEVGATGSISFRRLPSQGEPPPLGL